MADHEDAASPRSTLGDIRALDRRAEVHLTSSAARWIHDALTAWTEDDYAKVAMLAPLAVEHLGKAVLWRENPALVVPLTPDAENSLVTLCTQPNLASPKLRTVGLAVLLRRLELLLGGLPIDQKQRTRMVEVRNGAVHIGASAQSRNILTDSLILCGTLLKHLDQDPKSFFNDHLADVNALLDKKRTEVGRQIAAKRARARRHLKELSERLGDRQFKETTDRLEEMAADDLRPDAFGQGLKAIDVGCPECGSKGRLFGRVDVTAEVDFDGEPLGDGDYYTIMVPYWSVTLSPQAFACNVCRLDLHGPQELTEGELQASRFQVEPEDLGSDFDPEDFAESEYGLEG